MSVPATQENGAIEVPLGKRSPQQIMEWLRMNRTPLDAVDTRIGRGGKTFYYLRHQHITETLNDICNHDWDFRVLRERMDEDCVTVLGQLTIRVGEATITKSHFGSSDVKRTTEGKPLSIGDDFKSAASDSLKKCASLLGLGLDLGIPVRPETLRHLHAVGMENCEGDRQKWNQKRRFAIRILTGGNKESSKDLMEVEARILIAAITKDPEDGYSADVVREFVGNLK